jgi:hypothetical protein
MFSEERPTPATLFAHKAAGAASFAEGDFGAAVVSYTEAIYANMASDDYDARMAAVLQSNVALCRIKLGKLPDAEEAAKIAVDADPTWPRGHLRLGMARKLQGRYSAALAPLQEAARLEPSAEVDAAIAECRREVSPTMAAPVLFVGASNGSLARLQGQLCQEGIDVRETSDFMTTVKNARTRAVLRSDVESTLADSSSDIEAIQAFVRRGGLIIHVGACDAEAYRASFPQLRWESGTAGDAVPRAALREDAFTAQRVVSTGMTVECDGDFTCLRAVPDAEALMTAADDSDVCVAALHTHGDGAVAFVGDAALTAASCTLIRNVVVTRHVRAHRADAARCYKAEVARGDASM